MRRSGTQLWRAVVAGYRWRLAGRAGGSGSQLTSRGRRRRDATQTARFGVASPRINLSPATCRPPTPPLRSACPSPPLIPRRLGDVSVVAVSRPSR